MTDLMNDRRFDEDLLGGVQDAPAGFMEQLREAAQRPMTPSQMREQMISFVTGMLPRGSGMSRNDVAELLDREYAA